MNLRGTLCLKYICHYSLVIDFYLMSKRSEWEPSFSSTMLLLYERILPHNA